ncbi:hypothetical protein PLICRDRAFT_171693 [Plicaturopsis crispa FD-325 SS-3]|nr:hypothetical protein PLICRDRAFT_171693 [Plicaturopsis crispa FD-325 SS-3]
MSTGDTFGVRSSRPSLSEDSLSPTSTWAPPRSPLAPHRLAKLANALGVSTPLPAFHSSPYNSSSASFSGTSSPAANDPQRSHTPSAASTHNISSYSQSQSTSKFLLHVVPPLHLPHESGKLGDADLTPPPPSASGYHGQFRRGTLVPLHPTLQSQLGAIAKEYALPSTAGMILYLVTTAPSRSLTSSPVPPDNTPSEEEDSGEPGPRLSEEIWKHLWTRVLRAERDELMSAGRLTPASFGLGIQRSYSPQEMQGSLRPLVSPARIETPRPLSRTFAPSPSTPSSFSDQRSNSKSAPPSSSQSEPDTPNTSASSHFEEHEIHPQVEGMELPGLHSQSLIPILAKVEFDIDKRRAGWYEPWVRSRRMNHAKRAGSRKRGKSGDDEGDRKGPLALALIDGMDAGYAPLADGDEDLTVTSGGEDPDPLEDVFGTDADTWADIRADAQSLGIARSHNPNVVNLALSGAELSALPDPYQLDEDGRPIYRDEDEVGAIMDKMGRPRLASKSKHIPPPLAIPANGSVDGHGDGTPGSAINGTRLPYLQGEDDASSAEDLAIYRARSPAEEKRVGGVFDDYDLGLGDYDDNDPHDRRRSQYIMKAKLDEIERNLQQFSPNKLNNHLATPDLTVPGLSPPRSATETHFPPSPVSMGPPSEEGSSWPAVPFSQLNGHNGRMTPQSNHSGNQIVSPPQLAVNGVSTAAPPAFRVPSDSQMSSESEARRRELAEQASYSALIPPTMSTSDSPIPLSPDPFGRYPSSGQESDDTPPNRQSGPYWDATPAVHPTPPLMLRGGAKFASGMADPSRLSSRFSVDSAAADDPNSNSKNLGESKPASLVSVKSIRKLWRKSGKNSISGPPDGGRTSTSNAPPMPSFKEGPPAQSLSRPQSPYGSSTMPPPPPMHKRVDSNLDHFHFDQESPYPTTRRANKPAGGTPPAPSTSTSPPLPAAPNEKRSSVRKSILKSWKSASGSLSQSSISEGRRSSSERLSSESRQQNSMDASRQRGSVVTPDIPPSPRIPEQFVSAQVPGLVPQRQSQRPRPTKSPSTESATLSPPQTRSPLLGGASPPQSMLSAASSRESQESRPSLDTTQFDMVTPPPRQSSTMRR